MSVQTNADAAVIRAPSIKAWLDRWSWLYDIFGFIILSNILKYNTDWFVVFRRWEDLISWRSWVKYAETAGIAPLIGVAIIAIFYIGKSHAKASVENVADLFSSDRIPQDIYALKDRRRITAMLILNFLQFVALMGSINYPVVLCVLFLSLFSFYFVSNVMQRNNVVDGLLRDSVFDPWEQDPHLKFILARRAAAKRYLGRPHLWREMIMITASATGLATSVLDWRGMLPDGDTVAYVLLLLGVVLNEGIVGVWRRQHTRELEQISAEQVSDDIRRANERRLRLAMAPASGPA
jgi:hypothetical protein